MMQLSLFTKHGAACCYVHSYSFTVTPCPLMAVHAVKHAVVVGGGVGGVTAVGALSAAGLKVTWFDPSFAAGNFAGYRDVPANTKIALLAGHFEDLIPQGIPEGAAHDEFTKLKANAYSLPLLKSDPDEGKGWCGLDAVGDVLSALTKAVLLPSPAIRGVVGSVRGLRRADEGGWTVSWDDAEGKAGEPVEADMVVLSTGCVPVDVPPALLPATWASPDARAVRVVPLEEALSLSKLRAHLAEVGGGSGVVAVVGGGHSGVVLVRALLGLDCVERVRLFTRSPLQLAQWDALSNKYGAWAFRGLKGAAAELATKYDIVGLKPPNGLVGTDGRLELWDSRALGEDAQATLGVRAVVYGLGYTSRALPAIHLADGTAATVAGSAVGSGQLFSEASGPLPGLYGAGLAFAEDEDSSGAPYPEASLKAFTARARDIVREVVGPQ